MVAPHKQWQDVPIKENSAFYILAVSLLYTLLFNTILFRIRWQESHVALSWQQSAWNIVEAVSAILCVFPFFYLFTVRRALFLIAVPLIFMGSAWSLYAIDTYGVDMTAGLIESLLVTNVQEITPLITTKLLLWTVVSLMISACVVWAFYAKDWQFPDRAKIWVISFCGSMGIIFIQPPDATYLPYRFINPLVAVISDKAAAYISPEAASSQLTYTHEDAETPLTAVLIIGEAARAKNFHINGYPRQTTPQLEQIPNLINFSQVSACSVATIISVPCIITGQRPSKGNSQNLIRIFAQQGFDTVWISTQIGALFLESTIEKISKNAKTIKTLENRYMVQAMKDEYMLPYLDDALKKAPKHQLIILHSYGSHWPYHERYNEAQRKFLPDCDKSTPEDCSAESLLNSYDNSILYTDQFIADVIKRLQDKKAFVIYVSDHGESLGENRRFLHGVAKAPEQKHVPMFWWGSDSFLAQHPQIIQALKARANTPLDHFTIFPSMLGCAGISGASIDKNLSICSPMPKKQQ